MSAIVYEYTDNVHIHSQGLTQLSQGVFLIFLLNLVKERGFFFSFTPMRNCKASSSFDTQEAQLTICSFFPQPSLTDLLLLCYTTDDHTTPPLSCTDCEKCTYDHNLVHPCIFFLYGEKLLVRREYLKFD